MTTDPNTLPRPSAHGSSAPGTSVQTTSKLERVAYALGFVGVWAGLLVASVAIGVTFARVAWYLVELAAGALANVL